MENHTKPYLKKYLKTANKKERIHQKSMKEYR